METEEKPGFVQSRLPWFVAVAAFIVCLATLNHWVSLGSLQVVGNFTDPNATTPLAAPLQFVVTYPFRWLPPGIQIFALNLFATICASLALALLARSVILLPHDRTREQRHREFSEHALLSIPAAWAPPLFAVLVCGLQLSFWEHATAATGEMLDLLLFAYVIRCLLEYRITQRESWLTRMAFVYGLATTNNYAMIGFFPACLVALVWIKGRDFFRLPFLLRMVTWGVAGLVLYLLLPLLTMFDEASSLSFWQALRLQLAGQKAFLLEMPRDVVLFASLTSLLPALLIGIRWPSSFGDISVIGNLLTNLVFRVVHGLFLLAGLWVAFDAPFSPRALMSRKLQQLGEAVAGVPFLTFYYLGALCVGYFVGYYLLVLGEAEEQGHRPVSVSTRILNVAVLVLVWGLIVAAPAGLVYRNLPAMRVNNGSLLREYALLTVQSLPERGALVLSDNPQLLALTQTLLNERQASTNHLLVYTRFLSYPVYQKFLHQRSPARWPALPFGAGPQRLIDPALLMFEVSSIVTSNVAFYLHPSVGYYFEPLYLQPEGPIYRLAAYRTNEIAPPPMTDAVLARNSNYWAGLSPRLERLATLVSRDLADARTVGRWYSRGLNSWGVELQRASRLKEATWCFAQAKKLNPDNLIAEVNLDYNQSVLNQQPKRVELGKSAEDRFGPKFRTWDAVLSVSGPVDEPGFCFTLGRLLREQSLFRQAALQFQRVLQLEPDNLEARFWLAGTYLAVGLNDKALETAAALRTPEASRRLTLEREAALVRLEALAYNGKGQSPTAERVLLNARAKQPKSEVLAEALVELYISTDRLTEALTVIQEQLALAPGNVRPLINKAVICMKLQRYEPAGQALSEALAKDPDNVQALLTQSALFIQTQQYTNALPPLNRILELQPGNQAALLNRAIALLQSNQLEDARRNYQVLLKEMPESHLIHYGLAEIAYRLKETTNAMAHYEAYLKLAPPDTEEAKQVDARLKALKAGKLQPGESTR